MQITEDKAKADAIIVMCVDALAVSINEWAKQKGFWNVPLSTSVLEQLAPEDKRWLDNLIKSQKLALVTTETSEHVEAIRKPDVPSALEGYTAEEEECADQIIRLLDFAAQYKLRIGAAIIAKMAKNEGRPYKHGKEF